MTEWDSLRVQDYLEHILEAIRRIEEYVGDMPENGFYASRLVQDAVIRNIEIIGEAAKSLVRDHPEYTAKHSEIPWAVIYAMRNRVAHGYFKVDFVLVWKTIKADLPVLKQQVDSLRENAGLGD